jgi:flagellar basal-body rod modification protein FlgD
VDSEALQAAALVGHQVIIAGNGMNLTDAGAVGGVELAANADQVVVTIKDANGLVMNTMNLGKLDAGVHNFVWDGKTDAGVQAANGNYSISVAATQGENNVTATALQLAGVQNINRSSQGVSLNLGALGLVTLNDIKQIF